MNEFFGRSSVSKQRQGSPKKAKKTSQKPPVTSKLLSVRNRQDLQVRTDNARAAFQQELQRIYNMPAIELKPVSNLKSKRGADGSMMDTNNPLLDEDDAETTRKTFTHSISPAKDGTTQSKRGSVEIKVNKVPYSGFENSPNKGTLTASEKPEEQDGPEADAPDNTQMDSQKDESKQEKSEDGLKILKDYRQTKVFKTLLKRQGLAVARIQRIKESFTKKRQ